MFLWFPYFNPKSLGFFCIRLLVCFRVTPSQLLIEFLFIVLECPILSVLFTLCRYLFNLPSLASNFWFISSSCTVIFPHVTYSFSPPPLISAPLFIIRACFPIFFYLRFQSNFPFRFLLFLRAFRGDPYILTN